AARLGGHPAVHGPPPRPRGGRGPAAAGGAGGGETRRYKEHDDFTIQGAANRLVAEFGEKPLDVVVHSIANGSEVKNALLDTSRRGYLSAVSASAYSFVSLVQRFGPLLRPRGAVLAPPPLPPHPAMP